MDKDLNVKCKILKVLEKSKKYLTTLRKEEFFKQAQKIEIKNEKIDELDWIEIKICSSKDTINNLQRWATNWEKIFAIHKGQMSLIPNI